MLPAVVSPVQKHNRPKRKAAAAPPETPADDCNPESGDDDLLCKSPIEEYDTNVGPESDRQGDYVTLPSAKAGEAQPPLRHKRSRAPVAPVADPAVATMCLLSRGGHIYRGKCTAVHGDDPSKDDYTADDAGNKLGTLYTIRYIDEQQNGQKLSEHQL